MPDDNESMILDWLVDLKRYARVFYDKICSRDAEFKDIVKYDEGRFEQLFRKYLHYRAKFHSIIRGDIIDRHKVLAGVMLAATDKENLIFEVDYEAIKRSPNNDFPYWVLYPNEYYLCTSLIRILTDFILVTKKGEKFLLSKENYNIRFPDSIVWWEKDLAQPYEEQFCQMLSWLIITEDIAIKHSLLASHLLFFYELAYDCGVKEFSSTYYNLSGEENAKAN
jgi:hypothetical protein